MWTKFLNLFGIKTREQQINEMILAAKIRREARASAARRRAQAVITTTDVPVKGGGGKVKRPPTNTVHTRRGPETDWQVIGYTDTGSTFSYGSYSNCDSGSSSSYDSGSSYSGGSDSGSSSFSCD